MSSGLKFLTAWNAGTIWSLEASYLSNHIMEFPFRLTEWLDRYDASKDQIVPAFQAVKNFSPELISCIREQMTYIY